MAPSTMAVPSFSAFMLPALRAVADGQEHSVNSVQNELPNTMGLVQADMEERLPSGVTKVRHRSHWAIVYLAKAGAIIRSRRGYITITERGQQLLAEGLPGLTPKVLLRFPEFREFYRPAKDDNRKTTDTQVSAS